MCSLLAIGVVTPCSLSSSPTVKKNLMIQAAESYETSVNFYRITLARKQQFYTHIYYTSIHTQRASSSSGTTTLSWLSACSTIVEHSQQISFRECRCQWHVKAPTWRRTRDLERSNFRHKMLPASEATLANPRAEGGTMGEKWPRNFAESGYFHVTFGFFYMP
jgi:hypothetical protein